MTRKYKKNREFGDARRALQRDQRAGSRESLVLELLATIEPDWRKKNNLDSARSHLLEKLDEAIDTHSAARPAEAEALKSTAYRVIMETYGYAEAMPEPPYTESTSHLAAWGRWLHEKLASFLLCRLSDPNECIAVALLAAIVYGGLVDPKKHKRFARGIIKHCHFSGLNLRVDLSVPSGDRDWKKFIGPVQWFAPAFCSALIWRVGQVWGRETPSQDMPGFEQLRPLLCELVRDLSRTEDRFANYATQPDKRLYQQLMDAVRIDLFGRMDALLVEAACGNVSYASLPDTTWQRLETMAPLKLDPPPEVPYMPTVSAQASPRLLSTIQAREQLKRLLAVCGKWDQTVDSRTSRKGYKFERRKGLAKEIKEHLEKGAFGYGLVAMLAAWAYALATTKTRHQNSIVPGTIQDYVGEVGWALLAVPEAPPLEDCSDEEFITLYRKALKTQTSEAARPDLAHRLVDFHEFVVRYLPVDSIAAWEIDPTLPKKATRVKANIVAPWEYRMALDWIASQTRLSERDRLACTVLLILLYRSGARIREVLWLSTQHLHINTDAPGDECLHVINSRARQTKTSNGPRVIPLQLAPDERDLIVSWLRLREGDPDAKSCKILFSRGNGPEASDLLVVLYRIVGHSLLAATGDPEVTVHTLRHTFISYHVLWNIRANTACDDPFDFARWADGTAIARSTFHAVTLRNDFPTIDALPVLAQAGGHGHPETTIQNYTHVLDWLIYKQLDQYNPPLKDAQIATLLSISGSDLPTYRSRQHDGKNEYRGVAAWIWRDRKQLKQRKPPKRAPTRRRQTTLLPRPAVVSFHTLAWALQRLHNDSVAALARHLGRSPEEVQLLLRAAEAVAEKTQYEFYSATGRDTSQGASARVYQPPRNHILRDACAQIEHRTQTSDADSEIRHMSWLWLQWYRVKHSALYFTTLNDAVEFARFLRSLGLEHELRLVESSSMQKTLSPEQREERLSEWAEATGIRQVSRVPRSTSGVVVRATPDAPALALPGITVIRTNQQGREVQNFRSFHDALFLSNVWIAWQTLLRSTNQSGQ